MIPLTACVKSFGGTDSRLTGALMLVSIKERIVVLDNCTLFQESLDAIILGGLQADSTVRKGYRLEIIIQFDITFNRIFFRIRSVTTTETVRMTVGV